MNWLFKHRFFFAFILILILSAFACVNFIRTEQVALNALITKRKLLMQALRIQEAKLYSQKNNQLISQKIKVDCDALLMYLIGLELKIDSWQMTNTEDEPLVVHLKIKGKADAWQDFFKKWRQKNFLAFIHSINLETNREEMQGDLKIWFFPHVPVKSSNVTDNKQDGLFFTESALVNKRDYNVYAAFSLLNLRMAGYWQSSRYVYALIARPDGQMMKLKKDDNCCIEKAKVIFVSASKIVFKKINGQIVEMRNAYETK